MPPDSHARPVRPAPRQARPQPPASPTGRIDLHCHLLPGVDDGCKNLDDVLECIRALQGLGYVGSVCTPHINPRPFPDNVMPNIRAWTTALQQKVREAGLDYQLWPGGELSLHDNVMDWLAENETPTLAASRCVLTDFWGHEWPDHVDAAFDWLLERGYQPILAHPERLNMPDLPERLETAKARGVWLQGNFGGLGGDYPDIVQAYVRQFLDEGRYDLLATDLHRPAHLASRAAGIEQARQMLGADRLDEITITLPRRHLFGT